MPAENAQEALRRVRAEAVLRQDRVAHVLGGGLAASPSARGRACPTRRGARSATSATARYPQRTRRSRRARREPRDRRGRRERAPPSPASSIEPHDHALRRGPRAVRREEHLHGVLEERRRAQHAAAAARESPRASAGSAPSDRGEGRRGRGRARRCAARPARERRGSRERRGAETRAASRTPAAERSLGRPASRRRRGRSRPVVGEGRKVVPAVRAHDARRRRSRRQGERERARRDA